jgi:hypothetical protein
VIGGGGGAFGVIVEATVKAYPDIPITGYNWWINASDAGVLTSLFGTDSVRKAATYLAAQLPSVNEKGVSGYFYVTPGDIRRYAIHPGNISGTANANAVWKPILDKMQSFPSMTKYQTKAHNFKSFKEFYDTSYGVRSASGMGGVPPKAAPPDSKSNPSPGAIPPVAISKRHGPGGDAEEMAAGGPISVGKAPMDSRLLGAKHLQHPDFTKALQKMGGGLGLLLLAGNKASHPDDETSTTEAWRTGIAHAVGMNLYGMVSMDGFRDLAPEMGSYANEVRNLIHC